MYIQSIFNNFLILITMTKIKYYRNVLKKVNYFILILFNYLCINKKLLAYTYRHFIEFQTIKILIKYNW